MRADGVPELYYPRLVFQSDWCYCPLPVAHITAVDEGLQSGYHLQLAQCVYSPLLQRSRAGAFSTRRTRRRWRTPLVRPWLPNVTCPPDSDGVKYSSSASPVNRTPMRGRTTLLINNVLRTEGILESPLENHAQVDMMETTP